MSCELASKILTQNCDSTQTRLIHNRPNVRRLRQTMATVKAEIPLPLQPPLYFLIIFILCKQSTQMVGFEFLEGCQKGILLRALEMRV